MLIHKKLTSFWKKKKILYRCAEYISELFGNHRNDYNVMEHNFAGPTILVSKKKK